MGEDSIWIKRIRQLTKWLILSGALNVAFLSTMIYLALPKRDIAPKMKIQMDSTPLSKGNLKVLGDYFALTFEDLLKELDHKELIEDGYHHRDLALSCLVSFYYFNLEKALPGIRLQKRKLAFVHVGDGEQLEVQLYPGLDDLHFEAIRAFAQSEQWPLSPRGLFYELVRTRPAPESLKEAFYFTKEFHLIETLFNHLAIPMPRELLLHMLLQGGWERLASFCERHQDLNNLSPHSRRELLLDYAGAASPLAAQLLVETDRDFVLHQLDDERLSSVLAGVHELTFGAESLFKELLYSLRSDQIRTLSGLKLFALHHERPPEPYDHQYALQRFLPEVFEQRHTELITHRQEMTVRRHRIKEGDTLWSISRLYRVPVEQIMRENDLKSPYLIPVGKELKIP